jgi:hypothetical protein
MSSDLAALLELLLVFGVVMAWGLHEWWSNRKWLQARERERALLQDQAEVGPADPPVDPSADPRVERRHGAPD